MTAISGGKFWSGFAAGALSSIAASAWSGGNSLDIDGNAIAGTGMKGIGGDFAKHGVGMIAFGTVSGGVGAQLTGGNFWQGAVTGLVVSGLNHAVHKMNGVDDSAKIRENIALNAESKSESESIAYGFESEIDNFKKGTWKCNKFVYDVTTESGASPGLPNGIFTSYPPTAGQWADTDYDIKNWKVVSTPKRGDVVAYSNPNYTSATGHTGIMVSKTHSISAGSTLIQKNDFGSNQSRIQGGSPYVYRRYYAPIKYPIYIDPYWSRKNRAGGF